MPAEQIDLLTGQPAAPRPAAPHKGGVPSRGYLVALRLEQGLHPHLGKRLGPVGETCGSCAHLVRVRFSKTYLKCAHGPVSRGPATDIRAKWPSCELWKAGEAKTVLAGK
jgi:hypothetical protein